MDMGNRAVKTWRGGEGLEGGGQSGGKWEMGKKKVLDRNTKHRFLMGPTLGRVLLLKGTGRVSTLESCGDTSLLPPSCVLSPVFDAHPQTPEATEHLPCCSGGAATSNARSADSELEFHKRSV